MVVRVVVARAGTGTRAHAVGHRWWSMPVAVVAVAVVVVAARTATLRTCHGVDLSLGVLMHHAHVTCHVLWWWWRVRPAHGEGIL